MADAYTEWARGGYWNETCLPADLTALIIERGLEMQAANGGMPVPAWKMHKEFNERIGPSYDDSGRLIRFVKFIGHLKAAGIRVFNGRKWQFIDFKAKEIEPR
jgi:hypothetical protein